MALTKISTAMISQSAAAVDLNVDAGTFYVDTTNNRVGVGGKTDPDTPLHVIGTVTATLFAGSGASLTSIPNGALTNSSITINSTAVSLGGSLTLTTANIAENTNLYYTNARADARIAAADTDDLSEGSSNLYYTDARVDARVSGGSLGNITTTGYIRGPATFTLDPAAHGDNSGTVVIAGNLQVDGTTTTINSTTMTVDDKNITLASGSANAGAASGAGFTVDIGSGTNPAITYDGTNDTWDFNKSLHISGAAGSGVKIDSGGAIVGGGATGGDTQLMFWGGGPVYYGRSSAGGTVSGHEFRVGGVTKLNVNSSGNTIASGNITATNLYVTEDIGHSGDSDTYISFDNNTHTYYAGGTRLLDFAPGSVIFNEGGGDVDFRVEGVGNANALFVQGSDGKVGIGTSNPTMPLSVQADSGANAISMHGRSDGYSELYGASNDGSTKYSFLQSHSAQTKLYTLVNTPLLFGTNSTERMRIDTSGNVEVRAGGMLRAYRAGNSAYAGLFMDSGEKLYIRNSWGNKDIVMLRTGEVGIGTDAPTHKLHVNGTTATILAQSTNAGSNASIWFNSNVGGTQANRWEVGTNISAGSSFEVYDRVNGASRMTINSSGNATFTGSVTANSSITSAGVVSSNSITMNAGNLTLNSTSDGNQAFRYYRADGTLVGQIYPYNNRYNVQTYNNQGIRLKSHGSGQIELEGNVVINEDSANVDFRVESNSDQHALFLRGSDGNVGIGTSAPSKLLEVSGPGGSGGTIMRLNQEDGSGASGPTMDFGYSGQAWRVGANVYASGDFVIYDTNATAKMIMIKSDGNVGIGTTAPIEKLDVSGYQGISVNNNYAHMGSTGSGAMAIFGHNIKSDSSNNTIKSANSGYHSSMIKMYYNEGITFHATSGTQSAGAAFYQATGTTNELMRITNDGKVGIGTTSPDAKLSVTSTTINSEDILYLKSGADNVNDYLGIAWELGVGGNGPHSAIRSFAGPSGSDARLGFLTTSNGGTTLTEGLSIAHDGKVGIGTTTPAQPLQIYNGGGYWASVSRGNSTPGGSDPWLGLFNNINIANATYGWGIYDSSADGSFQIWNKTNSTTGAVALTIKRGGNVSIGPAAQESDTLTVTTTTTDGSLRLVNSNTGSGSTRLVFENRSTSPAANDGIGEIQFIGKNTAGNANGAAYVTVIAEDVTNGSYDSSMNISTLVDGYIRNRIRFTPTQTVVNEDSQALNFRVESNNNDNMIHVDGTNDRVGIGRVPATHPLEVQGHADFKSSVAVAGSLGAGATVITSASASNAFIVKTNHSGNPTALQIGGNGAINGVASSNQSFTVLNVGRDTGSLNSAYFHGNIKTAGNINPAANGAHDLGSAAVRWANVYTGDLHLSNEAKGGNDIDGTTGNWTVQEGEENLYLINNKTGKKYKFALEEIE